MWVWYKKHQRTWLLQRQRKLGQRVGHRRDELLKPMLRVEDLEVLACCTQQFLAAIGHVMHCCLVVAHEV